MIGRVRGWRRGWHERSKLARIDLYTRVTFYSVIWCFAASWGLLPLIGALRQGSAATVLGAAFLVVNVAQCVLGCRNLAPAIDHYRGTAPFPPRRLRAPAALQAVSTGLLVAVAAVDGVAGRDLVLLVLDLPMAFALPYAMLVPVRTYLLRAAAYGAAVVALLAAVGVPAGLLFGAVVALVVTTLLVLVSTRPSVWSLSVMWQAEEARDMQARLAVAEERLRFGRDMHDVLGRNLSVIALKSELAAELARRGSPDAVDQMVEVQRIARTSQQEVREVVRGYREADLAAEFAGARGVLEAAGIACTVVGDGAESARLPAPAQSALGWVVREAATNVLRHGDPRRCTIRLAVREDRATLVVENDGADSRTAPGAGDTAAGTGSGLAGLRERLAVLDGSLTAGPEAGGLFRLTATVPIPPGASPHLRAARPAALEER
ncbi:sensor histidine kinase [uncultured Streptomyces sp.]|uniref:sensor histidine kinase n=1 Tax=uncultured Streptomyces sp. TaxID=174707 RepID=UPI002630E42B|nr:histidine kinase [uncultured Streptomyces sp.]